VCVCVCVLLLQETARHIAELSRECKLEVDPDAYVESFRPFLMDIMYSWSKGASFAEICGITGVWTDQEDQSVRAGMKRGSICRVGQNHTYTVYIRHFGREITKYTVIYSVYEQSYTVYIHGSGRL